MSPKKLPSIEVLLDAFNYNPESGRLTWKIKSARQIVFGSFADSSINTAGYRRTGIGRDRFLTHRLIWKMMTGDDPVEFIDHIDQNKSNNTWANLRLATKAQNLCNHGPNKNNKTGLFKGVSFKKRNNRYLAQIQVNGVKKHLGYFLTPELARDAYIEAAKVLQGEFMDSKGR